ncbi:uncharacterized protein LOC130704459 [Daphnia carinata]|uniref:uncharacterized protein LOC130704459 n=1 Tax=Daphnia carinata TaxID=120202 RepID=UPI002580B41D|nr:uncharacterized protein LOC130704459 [Daphnia carinata]
MSVNYNKKKKERYIRRSKRPNAPSLLSSEEELSDRRSSSSTESSCRQKEDSKSQRSARKASKKSWQETLALLDCHFSGSSSDEEWNKIIHNNSSSDSDLDWNPMQKTQSRSSAHPKLTNIVMKRPLPETAHPPALVAEPHFKASDDNEPSTPSKLMAIDSEANKCGLKSLPPQILKAQPISLGGTTEQNLLKEGQTSPTIMKNRESTEGACLPILKLGNNLEVINNQESIPSTRTPKLKATYKKTENRRCDQQQGNPCCSPVKVTVNPTSLSSSEEILISVSSPGPPELIPIFEKFKRDSPESPSVSSMEEGQNIIPNSNEDETSESSLPPPKLTVKNKKRGRQKSVEQVLEEISSSPLEEAQAVARSSEPPKLMTKIKQPKKRTHKYSQPPVLEADPTAVIPNEEQQISVLSPTFPEFGTNVKKSKIKNKKSTQSLTLKKPELVSQVSKIQTSTSSMAPLEPMLTACRKVERSSSQLQHLATQDAVCISKMPEKEQVSKPPLPTPSKSMTIAKRKKLTPEFSQLPILKVMPTVPTSDEVSLSMPPPSELPTECSLSFAGIIPHNASLLEKGFDSGKFIMLKSDLKTQKSPSIWRIDGKNLLQKYESISYNDGVAYRNISTYSSWMASNRGLYVPIEVEFSVQSKSETIVTFNRNKVMLPVEDGMMEALNEEANSIMDTFQIYLQTLMSQALDSNFVKEIVKEQDDYFLTSIAAVEDHWILPKRNMLKEIIKMKKPFQELIETHPGLELRCVTSGDKSCDSCNGRNPTRSFEFHPLSYSFDTLDIMEGKPSNKTYRLCLSCTDRILLYHELFHMRYHLFICCQKKVNQYDQRDGPAALTASLADQAWKSLMHRRVLLVLAETQQVISHYSAGACVV